MTYNDLTPEQKRWFHAMYDESGGDISPDAVNIVHPSVSP